MFTYNGRDAHRNLTAARVHLPPKGQIVEILPERTKTEDDDVSILASSPALSMLMRCRPILPSSVYQHQVFAAPGHARMRSSPALSRRWGGTNC